MMDIRFFCVRTLPAVDTPNSRCRLRSRSKSLRRSLIVSSDVSSWPTSLFSWVQCTLLLAVARYDRVADPRHLPVGLHGHFGAVGVHVLFIGVYPGPQLSSSQGVVYSNNLPQTLVLINSLVDRVYSNTVRSRNRTYILIANMWRASRLIFVFLAGLAWARDWRKCGGACQEWRRIKLVGDESKLLCEAKDALDKLFAASIQETTWCPAGPDAQTGYSHPTSIDISTATHAETSPVHLATNGLYVVLPRTSIAFHRSIMGMEGFTQLLEALLPWR